MKRSETNVRIYLAEGLLKKDLPDKNAIQILMRNAIESLRMAEAATDVSVLWMIVCSYYAMFYSANAVLRSRGFKVGDHHAHKVTSDALVLIRDRLKTSLLVAYADTKEEAERLARIKSDEVIESFEYERNKRHRIQYETSAEHKVKKAQTSVKRAKLFVREMEKLLLGR